MFFSVLFGFNSRSNHRHLLLLTCTLPCSVLHSNAISVFVSAYLCLPVRVLRIYPWWPESRAAPAQKPCHRRPTHTGLVSMGAQRRTAQATPATTTNGARTGAKRMAPSPALLASCPGARLAVSRTGSQLAVCACRAVPAPPPTHLGPSQWVHQVIGDARGEGLTESMPPRPETGPDQTRPE